MLAVQVSSTERLLTVADGALPPLTASAFDVASPLAVASQVADATEKVAAANPTNEQRRKRLPVMAAPLYR